jgi:hypothetical protein
MFATYQTFCFHNRTLAANSFAIRTLLTTETSLRTSVRVDIPFVPAPAIGVFISQTVAGKVAHHLDVVSRPIKRLLDNRLMKALAPKTRSESMEIAADQQFGMSNLVQE